MKKVNTSYLAVWAGIPAAIAVILAVLAFTVFMGNRTAFGIAVFAAFGILVAIPMFLESRMKKMAAALESGFQAQGFTYQYKFQANNAILHRSRRPDGRGLPLQPHGTPVCRFE